MGTRINMAGYETLNEATEAAGMGNVGYYKVYPVYEAGMIDVLRQVAVSKLLDLDEQGRREYPPEYDKIVEEHAAVIAQITDALPNDHKELRFELEALENQMQSIEMDDQFIRGFIEGYKFLRSLNSSYRTPLLDVRK